MGRTGFRTGRILLLLEKQGVARLAERWMKAWAADVGMVETLESRRLLAVLGVDITFGHNGSAGLPGYSGVFHVARTLADAKILAAGQAYDATPNSAQDAPLVARFNSNGTLDTSFDGDGVLAVPLADDTESHVAFSTAAFAPDGKLVIVRAVAEQPRVTVFRFNADGTIDDSFGQHGMVSHAVGSFFTVYPHSLAVQADGKIVFTFWTLDEQLYMKRLNADGSVDTGFRGGLPATDPIGLSDDSEIQFGPDGKIYIQGIVQKRGKYIYDDGVVARFNTDGSLDKTYGGGDGFADIVDTTGAKVVNGQLDAPHGDGRIYLDKSGRVLINGEHQFDDQTSLHITRLTTEGVLDPTFGDGDGDITIVPDAGGLDFEYVTGFTVDSKGRIKGAVTKDAPWYLFRLRSDGTFDSSFGPEGKVELPPGPTDARWTFGNENILETESLSIKRYVANSKTVALDGFGELVVHGTDVADVISFEHLGDQVILHRNGTDTSFPFAQVKAVIVEAGAGGDRVTVSFAVPATVRGDTGNDTITLTGGDATVYGDSGNDKIFCGDGNHQIFLSTGNDRATTGAGRDSIEGGNGDDRITTGPGNDTISAGAGSDVVNCGSGNDHIYTGSGEDTIHGGRGNDQIQDTPDPPDYDEGPESTVGLYVTDRKTYFGDEGNDFISGGKGKDILLGNGGNDVIYGFMGSDYVSGGGGRDELYGSTYDDIYTSADTNDTDRNTIYGGEADDTIFAGNGNDSLIGDSGNDRITARGGNDRIYGGDGDDSINGGNGKDVIYGNGGNDRIDASEGPDTLHGNAGNDRFTSQNSFGLKSTVIDQIFGDSGQDSARSDKGDLLSSIESRT
jgi:uncharacterized delta-60 repeat protein